MLDRNKIIKITNRNTGGVTTYHIPDLKITRTFSPGESKNISVEEIESLANTRGGIELIQDFLIIYDDEVINEILPNVEPEYKYGVNEVRNLLQFGNYDEFLDCLDFAPQGVLDLIKDQAVLLEINDFAKREAIKQKLNFDVTRAIEIKNTKFDSGDEDNTQNVNKKQRRVAVSDKSESKQEQPQGRRTSAPIVENPSAKSWKDIINK